MKVLLDTHALIWWLADHPALSKQASHAISLSTNRVFVSAASAWEIAIKVRAKKLTVPEALLADFSGVLTQAGFDPLPMNIAHAMCAGKLPGEHRDPFDRMLIAQAQIESMALIGKDVSFDHYGINRIW
ncbi:MAG: type II toxin-antitoxin system VapC family toxin [Phycisphaerae bacterium]